MKVNFDLRIENAKRSVRDGLNVRTIFFANSFTVKQGARIAVRGESGAGKTTFLKLISGVLLPDEGQISWGSQEITKMNEKARDLWRGKNIGMIFQDFRLFPGLSAVENVVLPYSFYDGIDRQISEQAAELLRYFKIRPNTPTEFLSRGEMQRVAIVRALAQKPRVILADEPTASLDIGNAQLVLRSLLNVADELEATLIIVTHDNSIIKQFTQVAELNNGILTDGRFQ